MNEKTKEIQLPTKFNPGTMKFEPILPLRKTNKKVKLNVNWWFIIAIIIGAIVLLLIGFLFKEQLIKIFTNVK
ncbi:hypothetical protein HY212_03240 [Candidatus Pacearchaeota archaeon]|nr:hypothetical protein [Candidatus Pacearchaeota archaeon]